VEEQQTAPVLILHRLEMVARVVVVVVQLLILKYTAVMVVLVAVEAVLEGLVILTRGEMAA
jgi:hypothetical protein